ncbi:hypothetical protein E2C01_077564 [Portunus trituberculatus]|uniref:Uncharacterized protein n=1 Tax=Portunus trituberculatus TaxID=210409 RepID=A0A5B7IQ12_PORTR|nr:hypothetical protein [Portunus trituberculatus]
MDGEMSLGVLSCPGTGGRLRSARGKFWSLSCCGIMQECRGDDDNDDDDDDADADARRNLFGNDLACASVPHQIH